MTFPAVTAFYASLLALFYAGLSSWVVMGRLSDDTLHGDGGHEGLQKRIRSHGNFIEYVPFTLMLIGLLEALGGATTAIYVLLTALLVARVAHPFGMFAPKNAPQQFAFRGGGILLTLIVMAAAAVMLLIRTL